MKCIKVHDFTCEAELFPLLDAFPPSVPDDSFFESVKRETFTLKATRKH